MFYSQPSIVGSKNSTPVAPEDHIGKPDMPQMTCTAALSVRDLSIFGFRCWLWGPERCPLQILSYDCVRKTWGGVGGGKLRIELGCGPQRRLFGV